MRKIVTLIGNRHERRCQGFYRNAPSRQLQISTPIQRDVPVLEEATQQLRVGRRSGGLLVFKSEKNLALDCNKTQL